MKASLKEKYQDKKLPYRREVPRWKVSLKEKYQDKKFLLKRSTKMESFFKREVPRWKVSLKEKYQAGPFLIKLLIFSLSSYLKSFFWNEILRCKCYYIKRSMTVLFKTELPRRKVQLKEKNLDYLKTF